METIIQTNWANNFEVDWIGVQREIENGLSRRMRRELQVEPLILCLVQPAPSGTRAYIPKITEEQNFPIEIEIIIISIRNQTIIILIVQITHKIPKKVQKFHRIHQLRLLQKIHLKVEQEEEDLLSHLNLFQNLYSLYSKQFLKNLVR